MSPDKPEPGASFFDPGSHYRTLTLMIRNALQDLLDATPGALACVLVEANGIPLDAVSATGNNADPTTMAIEVSVVVTAARRAATMLDAGETREVVLSNRDFTAIARTLPGDLLLVLGVKDDADVAVARYRLRVAMPTIVAELA